MFHPKGGVIKREMEDYVRRRHIEEGFDYVGTPHIAKAHLFELSGHLPYYADTHVPADGAREQRVLPQGDELPDAQPDLPLARAVVPRAAAAAVRVRLGVPVREVRRHPGPDPGARLHPGRLAQLRDPRAGARRDPAPAEVRLGLLRDFGLDDFYLELSTRGDSGQVHRVRRGVGEGDRGPRGGGREHRPAARPDPGGAAFYGPKISVQARDAIGRTWQMSTIQYDFNQPAGFGLEYTAADGSRQQPVMIHSAKFGSIERFFGVLTEHYAGRVPARGWRRCRCSASRSPRRTSTTWRASPSGCAAEGIRVEVDASDDRMQKKIRNASKQKVPFVLIAGEDDAAKGAVSFRFRDGSQDNGVPVEDAVARIVGRRPAPAPRSEPVSGGRPHHPRR